MSIRIESIAVNGLGPIPSIQWAFKDINLVYGKNENGKTYLVEYILRSLFKTSYKTRPLTDSGQVIVSGIGNSPLSFNPKTRDKIDSLILGAGGGIPADLSRLCVVKAAETSMSTIPGETVTKSILKEYLSDQNALDRISDRIPAAVRESEWKNGEIIPGKYQGLIKTWREAQHSLEKVLELMARIDSDYSESQAKKASMELEEVKKKISLQQRAKRAYAYQVASRIETLQQKLDLIPESKISRAWGIAARVDDLRAQILKSKQRMEDLQPGCEHYLWLESAIEECEKRPEGLKKDGKLLFVVLSILSILLTIAASFYEPILSLVFGLLTVLFILLAYRQFQFNLRSSSDRQEVEKIYREYEGKFGEQARSIATLKRTRDSIKPNFYELETLKGQLGGLTGELSRAEADQARVLDEICGTHSDFENPKVEINKAQERRNAFSGQLEKNQIELASLNVDPAEIQAEAVQTKFDKAELSALEEKKQELEGIIASENQNLQALKQRICDITRDPISTGWDDLIENLRTIQQDKFEECKFFKAQIIAGIFTTRVISEFRKLEDDNIQSALKSDLMTEPLKEITHTYTGVELEGDELVVFNAMNRYPLAAMSTGAQEQVLLALRIGLAAHVLGNRKMFLILDDAFQHSDWQRREWLVDKLASLSKAGWQVIYFSMDDHIKQLFDERIKPKFNERYCLFELNTKTVQ